MPRFFETEYIGKFDISSHFCRCDSCRRLTMLSTYSTIRFSKLLSIPLLPLGKFRMVDECPQCGNRGITSARKYEKERKRNLALMMDGFASEADNPSNCAHALHTLMVYDMISWFHDVRKSYGLRFETNMQIQFLVAQGLSRFGCYQEAMNYCRKAIVLGAGRQAEELLTYCQTLSEATEGIGDLEALKVQPEPVLKAYGPLGTVLATVVAYVTTMGISSLRNYKAWIVNGTLQKYTFSLDDQVYELEPGATRQITLRLGEHELKTDSMPAQTFTYSIPLLKQLVKKHLLVINPDDMALLAVEDESSSNHETTYSCSGQIRIFPGLSSPQYGLRRLSAEARRTGSIGYYRPDAHIAMVQLMTKLGLKDPAVKYAQRTLVLDPATPDAAALLDTALRNVEDPEAQSFLSKGLEASPILIPWHVYYQNHMAIHHPEYDLEREYTLRCKKNSEDPASYYLLARILKDRKTAYSFYEHADRNDGLGGLGHYAIARDLYKRGQFKEALPYIGQAMELSPADSSFCNLKEEILLALRDYDALLMQTLESKTNTPSQALAERLVRYLTCAGYHREAAAEIAKLGEQRAADLPRLNAIRFYTVGNVSDYLDCMTESGDPHATMESSLHHNRIEEADELIASKDSAPYWEHLVVYCAAKSQNKPQIAAGNLEKAIAESGSEDSTRYRISLLLSGASAPTINAIRELDIEAPEKAILCVTLGYLYPDMQTQYNELALTYNFMPAYPQLLVRRWVRESSTAPRSTSTSRQSTQSVALGM